MYYALIVYKCRHDPPTSEGKQKQNGNVEWRRGMKMKLRGGGITIIFVFVCPLMGEGVYGYERGKEKGLR